MVHVLFCLLLAGLVAVCCGGSGSPGVGSKGLSISLFLSLSLSSTSTSTGLRANRRGRLLVEGKLGSLSLSLSLSPSFTRLEGAPRGGCLSVGGTH